MEYYRVRLKIAKKLLPKFKEEDLQWEAVKNIIKDGKANISAIEKSEDEFDRPDELQQFQDWEKKFSSDYFIEDSLLLNEEEAGQPEVIFQKIYENMNSSNFLEYSYSTEEGRFESFGFFNDESDYADMLSKEEKAAAKKEAKAKLTPEQLAEKKQVKMFKNKK